MRESARPSRIRAEQDALLARYVREEVYAYSIAARERLDAAGLGRNGVRGREDLARLPPVTLQHVAGEPAALVLRPDAASIARYGAPRLARRAALARLTGRLGAFDAAVVTPAYKPVHWVLEDGIPLGSSSIDLDRLAELGRRWLEGAGVRPGDVVVGLLPPGPHLAYWELVLAARRAALSAVHLRPDLEPAELARLRPTVLVGRPLDLVRLVEQAREAQGTLGGVHTLLAAGARLDDGLRDRLLRLLDEPGAAVLGAWAPPGVRALWAECRGRVGLHTWPEAELLEVVDPLSAAAAPPGADGEVLWTPLGWHGSVVLRLRTGVFGALAEDRCPGCGRTSPRLLVTSEVPPFLRALDRHPHVAAWQAELRDGERGEELVVFLTPAPGVLPGSLCHELDEQLSATQYVVLPRSGLEERVQAHGDRRVVDLRR